MTRNSMTAGLEMPATYGEPDDAAKMPRHLYVYTVVFFDPFRLFGHSLSTARTFCSKFPGP